MVARLRVHSETTELVPEGSRVLVGYSGGADSTCMLHLLKELGYDLVAAHLHHGQREEAETELKLCEAFCEQIGVPFIAGRADVPQMSRDLHIGLEEAGRRARYEFFRQAAGSLGTDLIATAHTLDDQVETVLFNLCRGTGMRGLRGIPAENDGVVRPMLIFRRAETRAYCEEHGIWFHDDPANTDLIHSRARIRKNVIPALLTINPALYETIAGTAEILCEEDGLLDGAAANLLAQAEIAVNGPLCFLTASCEAHFNVAVLAHANRALLRRAVRLAAKFLGADLDRVTTLLVVNDLGYGQGSITTEGGQVILEWTETKFLVRLANPPQPFRYPVTIPGEVDSREFGWVLSANYENEAAMFEREALEVWLDAQKIRGPLHFRSFQAGDKIQPMGFEGTRKIADLMSDLKLTQAARLRLPIICDMIGPVWIPGVCLADRVKPTQETLRPLQMKFGHSSSQ